MGKFSKLNKNGILLFIDRFLVAYVSEISGYKLSSPNVLYNVDINSIVVYIASRNYADKIMAAARAYGITDFIVFGDKYNQEWKSIL